MNVLAIIGILVQGDCCTTGLNAILSDFGGYIVARTGVPYRSAGKNVISVIIDAPADKINALSGKLGKLQGISAKTVTLAKPRESQGEIK
ncbi:MAG: CopG family transcriptional regulator [Synergistaceae bacterium]|nr:CopG family transcriptional regulator [Synergistaceae bacterium]